jgi:hypothetical protein
MRAMRMFGRVPDAGREPTRWSAVAAGAFWDPDARLATARSAARDEPGRRCVVYLDGWPGAGTGGALARLRTIGYATVDASGGGGAELSGRLHSAAGAARDAVVFVRGSPLAPALARFFAQAPADGAALAAAAARLVDELRAIAADPARGWPAAGDAAARAVVWCEADPAAQALKLAERGEDAAAARAVTGAYAAASAALVPLALEAGVLDAELHSTSAKQSVAQLLTMLKIFPSPVLSGGLGTVAPDE